MERQYYSFGQFRIDTDSRVLFHGEHRVGIPPKSAEVLLALLAGGGELVGKEELMKLVWPDTFVEENNLAKYIFLLRKTLGENEQGLPFIETVPKRGYRFVGQVDRERFGGAPVIEYEEHAREQIVIEESRSFPISRMRWPAVFAALLVMCVPAGLFLRGRTHSAGQWRSVLVLPFTTPGDTDLLLGAAFTQEVAARLRTIPALRVTSPLSAVDPRDVSNRLSIDTILNGRLDVAAGRLRVAAQLRSAQDGTVLWAENVTDLDAGDLQPALARMASSVAVRLCGQLLPRERARLERRGSTNAEAYEAFLRGRAEMLRNAVDVEHAPSRAAGYFETAVRLDPGFPDAWAGLARAQQAQFFRGSADRSLMAAAMQNARRALSIDPENILARNALIRIYTSTGQNEDMLREAKHALEINPADPDAQSAAAMAYFRTAMLDRAMDLFERYVAAYPDDEDAWFELVHACLFAKAYERGIRHAQPLVARQRLLFPTYLLYANSGDMPHAVALARQSIASGQGAPPTAYFSGLVLYKAGLETEAQAAWVRAAAHMEERLLRADNDRSRVFLGLIYARLHESRTAREQVRRALALSPGDPWVLFFASEIYALLGDRTAALESVRESVSSGFLGLHLLDYYQQAPNGWYAYRQEPAFVQIRDGLARRIADLRTRY
jgi:DNA-binding winged helix-turn-helix (wHTH) protein/tetratricopeptide (TPR) repeat protein